MTIIWCLHNVTTALPVLLGDGTRKYFWGAGGLVYAVSGSGAAESIEVYHTDGLGSARALTDDTGSVVQTYATEELGVPDAALTQGSSTQPFGYPGEPDWLPVGASHEDKRIPWVRWEGQH